MTIRRTDRIVLALLAACLAIAAHAACASPPENADRTTTTGPARTAHAEKTGALAGTSWRLVELQSMDDAVGTTRPDDPGTYTLTLGADGTARMVLDCNRANGPWSAEASSDTSGTFSIGPMAMTRAMCTPPALDARIAPELESIRSYLIRDGRLNLSLMADGGIEVWEPMEAADRAD